MDVSIDWKKEKVGFVIERGAPSEDFVVVYGDTYEIGNYVEEAGKLMLSGENRRARAIYATSCLPSLRSGYARCGRLPGVVNFRLYI